MTDPDPPGDPPPTAVAQTLYDRRDGRLALEVADPPAAELTRPHRTNYFTAYWVRAGRGTFRADDARHPFAAPCVLFLTPYQAARLEPDGDLRVTAVRFHANFLCIETHHHEVGCNGVLFNDPYGVPAVALDEPAEREVGDLVARMRGELAATGLRAKRTNPLVAVPAGLPPGLPGRGPGWRCGFGSRRPGWDGRPLGRWW